MSLVTLIRDYVDVANSSEQLDGYTFSSLVYYTLGFLFTIIKQGFVYCFTFHWLRDLSYFCLTPPTLLSSFGNISEIENQLQPLSNLLAFSDSHLSTGIGIVFIGFFNGCFSCLHISAAHLITIRRMLVQGVPAGFCSAFGTAVGQFFFLMCVLFGFRGLLFPWLALEPLNFVLGIAILLSVASAAAQDRRTLTVQWSARASLLRYASINAALAWCEQVAFFQHMGNTSVGIEPTFLEITPSLTSLQHVQSLSTVFDLGQNVQQLIQSSSYLLAFFLGSLAGVCFLGSILQRFLEFILRSRGIPIYYGLVKQANLPLATLMFAFAFGSLPYYGFDYLLAKGFGFFSNEPFFQQTLFSPTNLVSKTSQAKDSSQGRLEDQLALLFTLEGERSKSFAVDTTPFDNGHYLKMSQKRPQTFEDLNYRGEHLWTNRLSRISNIREQANQTQSSFLGPIFSWMRSVLWGDGSTGTKQEEFAIPSQQNSHDSLREYSKTSEKAGYTPEVSHAEIGNGQALRRDANTMNAPGLETSTTELVDSDLSSSTYSPQKPNDSVVPLFRNTFGSTELPLQKEQVDNYVREFDKQFDKGFSPFFNADPHSLIEVEDQWQEKRIKEKCYKNPIYMFLLNTEIDAFLSRQPNSHWLSPQEEALLLQRRQLLSTYYDTLALTSQVSSSDALGQLVPKSYANTAYNHQFKGTLKVARRLFSLKKAEEQRSIPPLQSSIGVVENTTKSTLGSSKLNRNEIKQRRVIKFDQPLFSKGKDNNQQIFYHEELSSDQTRNIKPTLRNVFLLEQSQPLPLYAGWDEQLRKLLITNRYQSRALAGYSISKDSERLLEFHTTNSSRVNTADSVPSLESAPSSMVQIRPMVDFTDWPIPNPFLNTVHASSTIDDAVIKEDLLSKADSSVQSLDMKTGRKGNTPSTSMQNMPTSVQDSSALQNQSGTFNKSTPFLKNFVSFFHKHLQQLVNHFSTNSQFLFRNSISTSARITKEPITNEMVSSLLQWQKLIKENKQLSKEDKEAAKERLSYWPKNVNRANWSHELTDNEIDFEEPADSTHVLKKQMFLWEFLPPNHGGFLWPGTTQ